MSVGQSKKSLTFLELSKGLTTFEILSTLTSQKDKERVLVPPQNMSFTTPLRRLKGVFWVFYASISFFALSPLNAVK